LDPKRNALPISGSRLVAVNDAGYPVGEDHHRAKLTNHDVDLILELREVHKLSYGVIAQKFEVGKAAIQKICNGQTRSQFPTRVKRLPIPAAIALLFTAAHPDEFEVIIIE
jgi:hypothetical protein